MHQTHTKIVEKGKPLALTAGLFLLVLVLALGVLYRVEIRSWYEFFRQFESMGKNVHGLSEYRHRQLIPREVVGCRESAPWYGGGLAKILLPNKSHLSQLRGDVGCVVVEPFAVPRV